MLSLFLGEARPARAAVTLVSFIATGELDRVVVEWETATELNNTGFLVWRSTSQNGVYAPVSDFIEGSEDPLVGGDYIWIDSDVVNGTTYWYKLEAVGQTSEFFGPVFATPGVQQPTSTLTATTTGTLAVSQTPATTAPTNQTPTRTATATATSMLNQTATQTATPLTPAPSNTPSSAYPAPGTATPLAPAAQAATQTSQSLPPLPTLPSPTPAATLEISPTITLLPFPELTLTFPEGGILLPANVTPSPTVQPVPPESGPGWLPTGGILLVVVLVVIWSLLGVWFYLSFQRIQ
jgi:hypothetical protein